MQNKHLFFSFLGIPTYGEGGEGGVKPVGPNSQLLPKICFESFPYEIDLMIPLNQRLLQFVLCTPPPNTTNPNIRRSCHDLDYDHHHHQRHGDDEIDWRH